MSNYDLFLKVESKYRAAIKHENGILKHGNVFLIVIPEKMKREFSFPDCFSLTALDYIKKCFRESDIEFRDVNDIEIHYYIEKCFK